MRARQILARKNSKVARAGGQRSSLVAQRLSVLGYNDSKPSMGENLSFFVFETYD